MKILAVDTSGDWVSIGLIENDDLLSEISISADNGCLKTLIPTIDQTLRLGHSRLADVDLLSVVIGPGAWSALRIGVTTLKTLAQSLAKPIVGVTSLDALAFNVPFANELVCPIIDARHRQVFSAYYTRKGSMPQRISEHKLTNIEDLINISEPTIVIGDGVLSYKNELNSCSKIISVDSGLTSKIRPLSVALLGANLYSNRGPDDTLSLKPLYLQDANTASKA